jgi:subtilisin family serine protease
MQPEEYLVLRHIGSNRRDSEGLSLRSRADVLIDRGPADFRVDYIEAGPAEAIRMREEPGVLGITRPIPVHLIFPVAGKSSTPAKSPEVTWGVQAVGAEAAGWNMSGIRVAVLDTGIDSGHEAFAGMSILERDFTGEGLGDKNGHGTHCAGTICGRDVSNMSTALRQA